MPPQTPLRLADQYDLKGVYTLDFPERPLKHAPKLGSSIINGTYRGFMELIFQNNDTKMQSYHMDGYAFFVVGYELNLIKFLRLKHVTFFCAECELNCLFVQSGWITGNGQRTAEALTTKVMVWRVALFRYALYAKL